MVKVILIKKTGQLKCSSVKIQILSDIYKKCGFINNKNFKKRHTWQEKENYFSIYAKDNGKAGSENKYELPPPLDEKLYFGTMIILKHNSKDISLNSLLDLKLDEYNSLYEKLYGGFDDLGNTDTEESEEEYVDPKNLTKEGYDKSSGFIVSDVDDDDTDFSSIEEEYQDDDDSLEDDSLEDNSYSEPDDSDKNSEDDNSEDDNSDEDDNSEEDDSFEDNTSEEENNDLDKYLSEESLCDSDSD